jgi:hypothetical protein
MNFGQIVRSALILGMLSTPWKTVTPQAIDSKSATTVVEVEKRQGPMNYKIDSILVSDLLLALGQTVREKGENCPVIALFNWDASLRDVYDVEVIASKAGFRSVRPFVVKNGFMSEIKFSPSIPFTRNPTM